MRAPGVIAADIHVDDDPLSRFMAADWFWPAVAAVILAIGITWVFRHSPAIRYIAVAAGVVLVIWLVFGSPFRR